jgi:hypothetical protein
MYRPVGLLLGAGAGLVAGLIFEQAWKLAGRAVERWSSDPMRMGRRRSSERLGPGQRRHGAASSETAVADRDLVSVSQAVRAMAASARTTGQGWAMAVSSTREGVGDGAKAFEYPADSGG